VTKQIFISQQW